MGADDPQALWLPSSNFDPGRNGASIDCSTSGDFSDAFYRATGALVGRVARQNDIPLDRTHVIGHIDLPDLKSPVPIGGVDHHHGPGLAGDIDRILRNSMATDESDAPRRLFDATRHNVSGRFREFWEGNGDGAVMTFGYQLSEAFTNGAGIVQYFERARFELRPGSGQNRWDVLLGRVGDEASQPDRAAFATEFTRLPSGEKPVAKQRSDARSGGDVHG